jgi:hypothetical protein
MRYTAKTIIANLLLAAVYLLVNINFTNYSITHLLRLAPLTAGATFLMTALLRGRSGNWPQWDQILRIYFTIGILLGLLFGLYYFTIQGQPPPPSP